ncbi:MAG: ATP-binding cassette domain-containing protein, partial [Terracidiphilus sp.]
AQPHPAPQPERPLTTPSGPPSGRQAVPGVITIGRNPESTFPLDLPTITWDHARIVRENGQYILEDLKSSNGTYVGSYGNRIDRAPITETDDVYFGSYRVPAKRLLATGKLTGIGEAVYNTVNFPAGKSDMVVGRDPECDVPLPSQPMVSWRHARLTRTSEGMLVEDLGSRNGTYIDGVRVSGKVLAKVGQEIGLGSFRFQLTAGGQLAKRDYHGNVTLEAEEISVMATQGARIRLLDPISFTIFPSELVALMGPAGAGKTTLLKALNGYTPPVSGTVLFNKKPLYQQYELFRQQMGYVPQDDIVHSQLTVREALYYSARLRTDLRDDEIETRILKVAHDLGIEDTVHKVIGSPERKLLSGGQRKRVNIALELMTDTPVLFLDEPTSGLSSQDALKVVQLLQKLARSGKTVVTTIHQPSLKVYRLFDDLIMLSRFKPEDKTVAPRPARLVYFGPAYPDSLRFFNPTVDPLPPDHDPDMIEAGMNEIPNETRTETWEERYKASKYFKEYVKDRHGTQPAASPRPTTSGAPAPRKQWGFRQWVSLVRRNITVKTRDVAQTAILLGQAPFFAILVCLIGTDLHPGDADAPQKLLIIHFLMVIAAVWFGCNDAARDIVGEWTIYRRERMVTLKLVPYVFSKLAVLFVLCAFQCASMLAVVYLWCHLHGSFLVNLSTLLLASMIGAGIGLAISAGSSTTESAIALLPVVLLPVIALGGGMRPIYELPWIGRQVSVIIPSRWAFEANLLEEAAAEDWKLEAPPCPPAAPVRPPTPTRPQRPGMPPAPAALPAELPRAPLVPDIAEGAVPHHVIPKNGEDESGHLAPVHPCSYTASKEAPAKAIALRHAYRDLMVYLGSMLVALIALVIGILWKRDSEPK